MAGQGPVFAPRRRLPRLMLPNNGYNGLPCYGQFHSIFENSIQYKELPELYNKRCVGSSSQGWLVMVGDDNPSIFAVNPLENPNRIQLPSLLTFPNIVNLKEQEYVYWTPSLGFTKVNSQVIKNSYLKKVFLSKDPTEEGCVAVAIFGELNRLAVCKVGDEEWKVIPQQNITNEYEDVVFDQDGQFYAVNIHGTVVRGCFGTPFLELVYVPVFPDYADREYLVINTRGELMLISRYLGWNDYIDGEECGCDVEIEGPRCFFPDKTSRFRVFKVNVKKGILNEVDSLEDGVVFLGDNQSLFLSSMEFPGCRAADCIYFTDDTLIAHADPGIGGNDIGVFDLKDGHVHKIQFIQDDEVGGIWPPPIWVTSFH